MRFLFACGGTAGHIYPAIAVAGRLRALIPDCEILFVGAEGKMEMDLVPREGYDIKALKITNLQRQISVQGLVHNIGTIKNLAFSMGEAGRIIAGFRPDVAVGTGGYVCYPMLYKAAKMGIPTAVHESNMVPGLTTRMLADRVNRVMVGFDGAQKAYKRSRRVIYTGTPVRGEFLNLTKEEARARLGLDMDRPLVVSFWGSLGAAKMNGNMQNFIRLNYNREGFRHIHATGGGARGQKTLLDALEARGVTDAKDYGIDIRAYIHDMPAVMAAADLVLCRAGASTLAELTALGKPAILVPSPNVTANHQEENAMALERGGGALMIREQDCSGEILYDAVSALLADPARLRDMGGAMERMGNPKATDAITEIVLEIMRK